LLLTKNKRGTGAQLARQNIHPVLADKKLEKEEEMDSIQKNFHY
jgi:hypothetical protein